MGNFIVRMNNKQTARGFYKWYDVVNEENQKKKILKKSYALLAKKRFRSWL